MSLESTAIYYRLTNELVRERLGGLHSARILMTSLDFAEVEELQVSGQWDRAGALLAGEAIRLEAAGADLLVLCTNTMHKVAHSIEESVMIPLLHLGDVTAAAVRAAGLSSVGLLGTAFTMSQDFYRGRLESHGLEVLVPDSDDQAMVHRVTTTCVPGRRTRAVAERVRRRGLTADRPGRTGRHPRVHRDRDAARCRRPDGPVVPHDPDPRRGRRRRRSGELTSQRWTEGRAAVVRDVACEHAVRELGRHESRSCAWAVGLEDREFLILGEPVPKRGSRHRFVHHRPPAPTRYVQVLRIGDVLSAESWAQSRSGVSGRWART